LFGAECADASGTERKGDDEVAQLAEALPQVEARPRLVFFYSKLSGRCRRVEGFIAQVLQRRRNHGTFVVHRVDAAERPDLVERFRIERLPALVVVADRRVQAHLEQPRGCRDIEALLGPWLK
jgi:thioredoxin-like negative regulator of GroEL